MVLVDPVSVNPNVAILSLAFASTVRLAVAVTADAAVTVAVVFEMNRYAKVAVALIFCAAVPLKYTALELAVNVPLFVQLPPSFKSPPTPVDKVNPAPSVVLLINRFPVI